MRCGQLGARNRKSNIGVARHDQANPGGRAIDRCNDRFGQSKLIGEILSKGGKFIAAGRDNVGGGAGVVAALLGMPVQRL